MAWLPVDESLPDHRKTKQLARELEVEIPTAIGYLIGLWAWALVNAPNGNLTNIDPRDICDAARANTNKSKGNASHTLTEKANESKFIEALVNAGFLDRKGQGGRGLHIHDWKDYGGRLCEARAKHRERMRRSRELIRVDKNRVDQSREEKSRSEPLPPKSPSPGVVVVDDDTEIRMP